MISVKLYVASSTVNNIHNDLLNSIKRKSRKKKNKKNKKKK
jgi:hypothetical protein